MKKLYCLFLLLFSSFFALSQSPVPMATQPGSTYTENFADIANWTNGFAAGIGANRFGSVAVNATGTIPDGVRITTASATFATGTSGGVQRGTAQTPSIQSIVLLSTGATDNTSSVAFDFFMDFSGTTAGTLSFDWASINNSTGDRRGSLRVYYSTDGTTYTELATAQVLNFINNSPTSGSITAVNLPAAFDNSPTARLRFYYHNAAGGTSGSRPKISIDNLTVTAGGGGTTTNVSVSPGTQGAEQGPVNGTFNINLTSPAPAGGVTVTYTLNGTATQNDDYTDPQTGSVTIPESATSAVITLNTIDDPNYEPTESINIVLQTASNGYTILNANASINIQDNDVAPISLTGGVYAENFNTLANAGASSILPLGWLLSESGTSANTTYQAGTGSDNGGNTYSFGAASNTERAFGTLQSGSLIPTIGAFFTNNTGTTITALQINYTGEQWRLGAADREDRLDFSYSLDANSLVTGTWTNVNQLDFIAPITTLPTGALDGNANNLLVSYKITGLSILPGASFYIRWQDFNASGADDGLGVDNFSIEPNPIDLAAPLITALSPAHNATDVANNLVASIEFDETVLKGSGNIYVKRISDNTIVQTTDIAHESVNLANNIVSFPINGLSINTAYYIEIDNGGFEDMSGNDFAGISGSSTWSFTTGTIFFTAGFDGCGSSLSDGFSEFSKVGPQVWGCTTFGRDASDPTGLASLPNGVQINGFSGTNIPNEDWLISPAFDLTSTTFPLLSFWSRTAFNGDPLQLKVSTNYSGVGDPSLADWTDLNGRFPNQASNVWTLSENINLSAFKQSNVYIAFVYNSSDDDGARWTLDDFRITNSPTPPPPSLTLSSTDLQFGFASSGSNTTRTFTITGNDITGSLDLTASGDFSLSKDNTTFSSAISFSQAEANNITKTVYVRFQPSVADQNFTGVVTISTGGVDDTTVSLKGTSIDPVNTLEVVNWNIEWFGSTAEGPTNEAQQLQNVTTIMQNVGADIFGLVEVVDETKLAAVVSQMPGYAYVISNYGSHTNTSVNPPGALAQAQKLAFVYKTSVFSNVTTEALLSQGINSAADISNPAYNYWASGRFPYMLSADVTLNCVTNHVKFVLVHAKANTSPTSVSFDRRKNGADSLHYTLNTLYPDANIVILGDFNDDLDQSITAGETTTSWDAFTTDNANYSSLTLPLSLAGKKSTVSYNDVIDHVVASNEMASYYMESTATILNDVASLVTNYGSTTSDHYPVFTRYRFAAPPAPVITSCPVFTPACVSTTGTYTVAPIMVSSSCGTVTYNYVVTGATTRSGNSANASGSFNVGTSLITWTITDGSGQTVTCETQVVINANPVVTIPDAFALNSGVEANTVYIGYSPASSLTLQSNISGGSGSYTYSWSNGDNTATTTVSPLVPSSYTLMVTDANGCRGEATTLINVKDVRGGRKLDKVIICHKPQAQANTLEVSSGAVADHLAHGDMLGACEGDEINRFTIKASPNPSSTQFTIQVDGGNETDRFRVKVTDIFGRVVEQKDFATRVFQIGKNYHPGIYVVEVNQAGTRRYAIVLKTR